MIKMKIQRDSLEPEEVKLDAVFGEVIKIWSNANGTIYQTQDGFYDRYPQSPRAMKLNIKVIDDEE